jgi:CheY-like chemotaxis protein
MPQLVLIDDDTINNLICMRKLQKGLSGLEIIEFTSARKALAFFQGSPPPNPDLILLDINMPDMNAWELLDSYNTLNLNIPVVIITSSIDKEDVEKAKLYPIIKQYLVKPLGESKIQKILEMF